MTRDSRRQLVPTVMVMPLARRPSRMGSATWRGSRPGISTCLAGRAELRLDSLSTHRDDGLVELDVGAVGVAGASATADRRGDQVEQGAFAAQVVSLGRSGRWRRQAINVLQSRIAHRPYVQYAMQPRPPHIPNWPQHPHPHPPPPPPPECRCTRGWHNRRPGAPPQTRMCCRQARSWRR